MTNNKMMVTGFGLVVVLILGFVVVGVWNNKDEQSLIGMQKRGGDTPPAIQPGMNKAVEEVPYTIDESDFVDSAPLLDGLDVSISLTADETAGLLLMREEEKLARDVYLTLADQWNVRVFSNIASSEATHMAAVGDLITRYDLVDPIVNDVRGIFTNPDLQKLYNDLVARGSVSVNEAFQVGALIEDLDIYDLENLLAKTDKADIMVVYENLQKGSRNHLRAFTRQIERGGDTYQPSYISEAEYQTIVESGQERGRM
jgi:hypothetical protein